MGEPLALDLDDTINTTRAAQTEAALTMNALQESTMNAIAAAPKPSLDYAKTLLELAEAHRLPHRVTLALRDYTGSFKPLKEATEALSEAKAANADAWRTVVEQAERQDDLLDLIDQASATGEALNAAEVQSTAAAAKQAESDARDTLEATGDEGEAIVAAVRRVFAPAVDYFATSWDDQALMDKYLERVPVHTNAPNALHLSGMFLAGVSLVAAKLATVDFLRRSIASVVDEFMCRIDELAHDGDVPKPVLEALASAKKIAPARTVFGALAPIALDLLDGTVRAAEVKTSLLASLLVARQRWDKTLCSDERFGALKQQLKEVLAKPLQEEPAPSAGEKRAEERAREREQIEARMANAPATAPAPMILDGGQQAPAEPSPVMPHVKTRKAEGAPYSEGAAAARAGKLKKSNPYTEPGAREAWNNGWDGAKPKKVAKTTSATPSRNEHRQAYEAGKEAFARGAKRQDSPYSDADLKGSWINGFQAAQKAAGKKVEPKKNLLQISKADERKAAEQGRCAAYEQHPAGSANPYPAGSQLAVAWQDAFEKVTRNMESFNAKKAPIELVEETRLSELIAGVTDARLAQHEIGDIVTAIDELMDMEFEPDSLALGRRYVRFLAGKMFGQGRVGESDALLKRYKLGG